MFNYKKLSFILSTLILSFLVGYLALAWTGAPTGTPPDCPSSHQGCSPPINVSDVSQTKEAGLVVEGDLTADRFVDDNNTTYYIDPANGGTAGVLKGSVGIGTTTTPNAKLDVTGSIKIGYKNTTCNASIAGAIRYNSGKFEGCDGEEWRDLLKREWACGDDVVFIYKGVRVTYGTINGQDGSCWMDRNLGATKEPSKLTGYNDPGGYGDLFQWGRLDDKHQTRSPLSGTTPTKSSLDVPGHSNFITTSTYPHNWRSPMNNNLWQGGENDNNPCPSGWHVPTTSEWISYIQSTLTPWYGPGQWDPRVGAFNDLLKLTMGGQRQTSGNMLLVGVRGYYWARQPYSSSPTMQSGEIIVIDDEDYLTGGLSCSVGASVRCILGE